MALAFSANHGYSLPTHAALALARSNPGLRAAAQRSASTMGCFRFRGACIPGASNAGVDGCPVWPCARVASVPLREAHRSPHASATARKSQHDGGLCPHRHKLVFTLLWITGIRSAPLHSSMASTIIPWDGRLHLHRFPCHDIRGPESKLVVYLNDSASARRTHSRAVDFRTLRRIADGSPIRQMARVSVSETSVREDYYFPLNCAARFSKNAFVPSALSSVEQATANSTASR